MAKERWGSKLGVILAVAGSAVGLGNFLRFPGQVAQYGGGAFIIPYLVALFLLGVPLMWVEWTIGRFGGGFGHSTAPGAFHTMWNKNRFIKYFGVIGIFGPAVIYIYYVYIESWLLGYSVFALGGAYKDCQTKEAIAGFLGEYTGAKRGSHFSNLLPAYGFFLATFAANIGILLYGIRGGIERVCKIALPLLVVLAVVLVVRVFTLGTPNPQHPENNVINGLGYLWNPKWEYLAKPDVWLAAAGQIFFTLSVGIGAILTYASYLKKNDDVALSGLTASAANEFAEVILGGSIVIPAAFTFFGMTATQDFAKGGTFQLGFLAMPMVLEQMPGGNVLGFMWFLLLFLAGITSSISLAQPAVAFLEDEFNLTKRKAVILFGVVTFIICHVCILGGDGVIDEMDFWGGKLGLVVFALVEAVLFAWVFGMDRAWTELHTGSDIRIPTIYRFILKYVTPLLLIAILVSWCITDLYKTLTLEGVDRAEVPWRVLTRVILILVFALLCFLVWAVWRRRRLENGGPAVTDQPAVTSEDKP